jgi:hypothetical protein
VGIRRFGSKSVFIVVILATAAIVVDTSIVKIVTSAGGIGSGVSEITLFTIFIIVFGVGQYIILNFIKYRYPIDKLEDTRKSRLRLTRNVVTISQYILLGLLIIAALEMLFTISYSILILRLTITISYGISVIVLALLVKRFFYWFKSNKNWVVLIYGLAISAISINSIITIIYTNSEFNNDPAFVRPVRSLTGALSSSGFISGFMSSSYVITSVSSFVLMWIATALLLKNYSRKLGRVKYWIIVSIPLAYFLGQFQPLFLYSFADLRLSDPVLFGIVYNLIFSLAKPAGGILFGIAFWTVTRRITSKTVKEYMIISAYGMTLLFAANQPLGLLLVPYPPFGLPSICFMVVASYLIFLGIHSAAISVSEDTKLRQSIRKAAIKESARFLDSIGTAEMTHEIERKVVLLTETTRDNIERETGISTSFDYDDIKMYLEQVLQEVKRVSGNHHRI